MLSIQLSTVSYMKEPLWTSKYKPEVADFSQESVRRNLKIASDSGMNLLITGPKGVGKTASARAITREIHENPDNDVQTINMSDVFNKTKKELSNHPRFSNMISSTTGISKRNLINKLITEIASYPPVTGGYKTLILDNAENAREDFQHALRRTIEKHSESTQFIITTRNPSNLIDPIASRCYPIQIVPPSTDDLKSIVERISEDEDLNYTEEGINYIWSQVRPNVREFLLLLQTSHNQAEVIDPSEVSDILNEISKSDEILSIIDKAKDGEYKDLKSEIEHLVQKEGYSEDLILELIVEEGIAHLQKEEYIDLCNRASRTDVNLDESVDGVVPIVDMLSNWNEER